MPQCEDNGILGRRKKYNEEVYSNEGCMLKPVSQATDSHSLYHDKHEQHLTKQQSHY